jgi:GNAT superfamily N-acetyltransferase
MPLNITSIGKKDRPAVLEIVTHFWGDPIIVVHGDLYHIVGLDGLKAVIDGEIVGILHYLVRAGECEILTLASLHQGQGIGSALLAAIETTARSRFCSKLTLITTNDNLHALGFYQRRGFRLVELYPGQVDISRKLKPAIPLIGQNLIPLRDELKLKKTIS